MSAEGRPPPAGDTYHCWSSFLSTEGDRGYGVNELSVSDGGGRVKARHPTTGMNEPDAAVKRVARCPGQSNIGLLPTLDRATPEQD